MSGGVSGAGCPSEPRRVGISGLALPAACVLYVECPHLGVASPGTPHPARHSALQGPVVRSARLMCYQ